MSATQTTTPDAGGSASWQPPSRAVRWAAYATPLCVLPSAVWRIWYVFVDADPDCVGHGPAWEQPYIVSLSVGSVTAAFLTVGLVRPWGEVVPRWVPLVGGRPVPVRAATGAAAAGATLIFTVYTYAVLNGVFHWREGRRFPAAHLRTRPTGHGWPISATPRCCSGARCSWRSRSRTTAAAPARPSPCAAVR